MVEYFQAEQTDKEAEAMKAACQEVVKAETLDKGDDAQERSEAAKELQKLRVARGLYLSSWST